MTITARFASTCPNCGSTIEPGTEVEWSKGQDARHLPGQCPANPVPAVDRSEELPVPQEHTRAGRMLLAGELDATITMASGQHCTVYARALRRTSDGWDRVSLLDDGAKVRLAAGKRGQRIGWIKTGFRVEWDAGVSDQTKDAVRALFSALGHPTNTGGEVKPKVDQVDGKATITNAADVGIYAPAGATWLRVQVANHCGRCGLELTQPVSIDRGVGPECYGKMTAGQHVEVVEPAPVRDAPTNPVADIATPGWSTGDARSPAEDAEVTLLLTQYDRTVARLAALGVDVHARDRANAG